MTEDRFVTIPNALSLLRLIGVPVFLWLVLVAHADVWAFALLAVSGATDWLDGYLARRLGQVSRIGALLDPLADRLYIAATLLGLALRALIPWWLVIALVAREIVLICLLPLLRRHGRVALPVTFVGKTGTFALLWGFPLLLLGSLPSGWGAAAMTLGWAFALWGVFLYWWAGLRYVQQARSLSAATPLGS
ncbi:MAG: CDP-alcohol phosphatidyltransferase family protein [Actinomycetes bacterium]|jgi:cardiolipin synthase